LLKYTYGWVFTVVYTYGGFYCYISIQPEGLIVILVYEGFYWYIFIQTEGFIGIFVHIRRVLLLCVHTLMRISTSMACRSLSCGA
jgi:hypothetical protein